MAENGLRKEKKPRKAQNWKPQKKCLNKAVH
jgi:hypothetical protein